MKEFFFLFFYFFAFLLSKRSSPVRVISWNRSLSLFASPDTCLPSSRERKKRIGTNKHPRESLQYQHYYHPSIDRSRLPFRWSRCPSASMTSVIDTRIEVTSRWYSHDTCLLVSNVSNDEDNCIPLVSTKRLIKWSHSFDLVDLRLCSQLAPSSSGTFGREAL